jgi:hypothetical protein
MKEKGRQKKPSGTLFTAKVSGFPTQRQPKPHSRKSSTVSAASTKGKKSFSTVIASHLRTFTCPKCKLLSNVMAKAIESKNGTMWVEIDILTALESGQLDSIIAQSSKRPKPSKR